LSANDPIADIGNVRQIALMSPKRLPGPVIAIVASCLMAYILVTDAPRLPISAADGTYFDPCCGTFTLKQGRMLIGNQRISYLIESDKAGAYVLPGVYVGASPTGFVIRTDAYPLKLRLDDTSNPRQVELLDTGPTGALYTFKRVDGS
jgi:hypothetical protein